MDVIKNIYENDINEYRNSSYKFGICMATYQRKNGKSPSYLNQSLTSIINQTADNWHLYLVGDKYEDENEINKILESFPKNKLTFLNLPYAHERDNIKDQNKLWTVGGSNASNHSYNLAVADNCDYIIHTDDDDPMHIKKIQILNYILTIYSPICMFHYSTYLKTHILPREQINIIEKNNHIPRKGNVAHSSLVLHKSIASVFKYDGYRELKTDYSPNDIELIMYIEEILKNKDKYCIFVPLILCNHDIEKEVIQLPKIMNIINKKFIYKSKIIKS